MIQVERVYDHLEGGSPRFLVDRLWPRGVKKTDLALDGWLKEAAPSNALRAWYGHDPDKWPEFKRRYDAELKAHPDAWAPLLAAAKKGSITLLFGTKELERNNAVALKAFLERRLRPARRRT